MKPLQIGLLDFGIRTSTMNSSLRVNDLIEYAIKADKWGFSRIWISEHHLAAKTMSWSNPSVLVPLLAGMTSRINVGVAGILLGIHQPYHVASNFKMLANLFPDRIDLGLANGGVMPAVAELATGVNALDLKQAFTDNLKKLHFLFNEEEKLLELGTVIPPFRGATPDVWSLSTHMGSLQRPLDYKMNLARSIFHKGADKELYKEELISFKEQFLERHGYYPKTNLVVSGAIHKTEAKVKAAVLSSDEGYNYTLLGTPSKFEDTFHDFQESYGFDEIIFMNVALKPKDRAVGLELLSDTFQLHERNQATRKLVA